MSFAQDLRASVLQAAMQGTLTGDEHFDDNIYKSLWEVTIWDKKFKAVEKHKQSKTIDYFYYLAADMKALEVPNGDVFLLSTGNYKGWTTEEKAGNTVANGEVVAIPWGGSPNVKYYKGKFVTSDNRIATSFDTNVLSNLFLYYFMLSKVNYLDTIYRGTSLRHPNMSAVLEMKIPIPPIEEQKRIVRRIEEIMKHIDELEAIEEELKKLKEVFPADMKAAVLQAAMQGKLTEQLKTDSSVDDLLEDIKKEREKLVKEGKIKKSRTAQNYHFVELEDKKEQLKEQYQQNTEQYRFFRNIVPKHTKYLERRIKLKIENVIYIITNPQFPGYVKIGYASDLKQRLTSLNTGMLLDFEPYAVYETPKDKGDTEIHDIITLLNPILRSTRFDNGKEKKKEFFKLDPEEAFKLFEHIAIVSGTRNKLYRVDKYLNKLDTQSVISNPSTATQSPVTNIPAKSMSNNCIPDGIYTMKTKIKSINKVVHGTLEVKNGKLILKAGSDVAPESARYERNKQFFIDLKIQNDVLTEDKETGSVSTAACIVRGGATNGWDYWKNSDGNFISIYRKGSD